METDTDEYFILNNIKQESPVEFVLILPNPEQQTLRNIKTEENEINQTKNFTIRVKKFDRGWKNKPKMFSTKSFCGSCKVVSNSKVLKHSTSCDQKNDKDSKDLNQFKCDLCPVTHKIKNLLRNHIKYHIKHRNFVCRDCGYGSKTKPNLLRHIRQQKPLKCEVCEEEFKCRSALRKHEKLHANNFKCDQCSYVGTCLKLLQSHKRLHLMPFNCETCHENFARKDVLITHQVNNKHGDFASAAVPKFCCDKCDYSSLIALNLYAHKKNRHENLKVSCEICSKVFKTLKYLGKHRNAHVRATCHICNKETTKQLLSRHVREHFEGTEYNCDLCGGQFRKRNLIKLHMVGVHINGEYACFLCRKKFETVHELFAHKKIHVGKCDYRCPKCFYKAKGMFHIIHHMSSKH